MLNDFLSFNIYSNDFNLFSPIIQPSFYFHDNCPSNESIKLNNGTNQDHKICAGPKEQIIVNSQKKTSDSFRMLEKKTKRKEKVKNINLKKQISNNEKKPGRYPNTSDKIGAHNRSSYDNEMRAIKPRISNYMHILLNNSIENIDYRFKKLESIINKELKTDFNLKLLKMTVKEIYLSFKKSPKYNNHSKNKIESNLSNENIDIIKYIEKNKDKEPRAYKILNLTYEDIILKFIGDKDEGLEKFKSEIKDKENNFRGAINIKEYISDIDYLCINFRNWFESKRVRKGTKRKK